MTHSTNQYNSIDLLKLLMAICVVAIHSGILNLEVYPEWIISSMLLRLGVPFFFVVSGFFLAGKLFKPERNTADGRQIVKDYCMKLFPPLILWGGGRYCP